MKASRLLSVLAVSTLLVAGSATAIRAAVTSIPELQHWESDWNSYLQYESAAIQPTPLPVRHLRVTCDQAALLLWPDNKPFPSSSHLPLAYKGEELDIVSDLRYTIGGTSYYETGFPVVSDSGPHNRHYWIVSNCVGLDGREQGKKHKHGSGDS